jgi:hypothetical protein
LEELAKGFKLVEKEEKRETFTKNEWKEFTGKDGHKKKLEYLQEVEDNLNKDLLVPEQFATSSEEDRKKHAEFLYSWRMDCLYVGYDFDKKQWINPLINPVIEGAPVYYTECNYLLSRATTLLQVLSGKLHTG